MKVILLCILSSAILANFVNGHGRLTQPPGRGTAWRYGFDTPKDYDDQSLNCGGLGTQIRNNGKCGICGDSYSTIRPRAHEQGGLYGTGVIVGTYKANEVIDVKVQLTANHLGYFKFSLCELNGDDESEDCFKPLTLEDNTEQVKVTRDNNDYEIKVQLPADVTCKQCVLRWTYIAGNNWGGPDIDQENFVNCADIKIE